MILAATGHRPNKLGGYHDWVYSGLRELAKEALIEMEPVKVISGMALGWDMAVADAAIDLDIPFIAAIPFLTQDARWAEPARRHYRELLECAEHIEVVSMGGYAAWKMQVRNKWLVDEADRILALWDGSSGGTANCVMYAGKKNKLVANIWHRWEPMVDGPC